MTDNGISPHSFIKGTDGGGGDARVENFKAGKRLAETIRTTLGPRGLDKLLVGDGKVVVTNDGASILDRMDIDHPAARLIVEVADQQEARVGDGTTSAVMFAGELLSEAENLYERGIHPTNIIQGYDLAAASAREILPDQTVSFDTSDEKQLKNIARTVVTGKWDESGTEFLADKAVQAVQAIERDGRVGFERITRKTVPGKSFYDSEIFEGLLIDMEESSTDIVSPEIDLPREYHDATVALVDEELSIDKPTGIGAVNPESYEGYEAFREHEREVYENYVSTIADVGADILFCQQSIDDPVRYGLFDEGILAVERTRRDELHKLARATGAQPVTMENLTPATVGRASHVERRAVGPTEMTIVSGFEAFDQISLLFRGGTEHVAEETKRMLDDCFYALKIAIEDDAVVPGGGAVEMAVAKGLRSEADRYDGREQLAIKAFAEALETIPRTLAETAGMDPVDALIELRNAHHNEMNTAGLDLQQGTVVDTAESGVIEPLFVKQQAISAAKEAANLVIRVDDQVQVTREHTDHDHHHESDHDHGPGELIHSTEGYPWAVGHSMGHSDH